VVIEAPIDGEHANAVIKEIRQLFGNKPIRYVVNTHAHFDASGGLRTFAVEGLLSSLRPQTKPILRKPSLCRTIRPDKLSQTKKQALIEAVAEKRILTEVPMSLKSIMSRIVTRMAC